MAAIRLVLTLSLLILLPSFAGSQPVPLRAENPFLLQQPELQRLLPREIRFLAAARSIRQLFTLAEPARWIKGAVGDREYRKAQRESIRSFGVDLTTLAGIQRLGIDVDGPAGLGLLKMYKYPVFVLFAKVSNRGPLVQLARKAAPNIAQIGGATVYHQRDSACIFQGRWMMLLVTFRFFGTATPILPLAKQLIQQTAPRSLANGQFLGRLKQLKYGRDLLFYLNIPAIAREQLAKWRQRQARLAKQANTRLLHNIQRDIAIFQLLTTPLGDFLWAGRLSKGDLTLKSSLQVAVSGYLRGLFKANAPLTGVHYLRHPAALGLHLEMKPDSWLELLLTLAKLSGNDIEAMLPAQKFLGYSVQQLLSSMLDGHTEFYATLDRGRLAKLPGSLAGVHLHFLTRVKSVDLVKGVIGGLSLLSKGRFKPATIAGIKGFRIELKHPDTVFYIAVVRQHMVVSNDAAFIKAFATNKRHGYRLKQMHAGMQKQLMLSAGVFWGLVKPGFVVLLDELSRRPPRLHPTMPQGSPELHTARQELYDLELAFAKRRLAFFIGFTDRLGTLTARAGTAPYGFVGVGTWSHRERSWESWFALLFGGIYRYDKEKREYFTRRWQLMSRIRTLRNP